MSMPVSKCSEVLEKDQRIADDRLEFLEDWGILEMFDRVLILLDDLMRKVEAHTATLSFPLPEPTSRSRTAAWNDRLRLHMLGSCIGQYLFAFSHLCRAQTPEIYGHMRRAMEAAGVAYLSKSEPDIGKIYGKGDESKLWKRIKRHKIFPEENPLTSELNEMMKRASSRFHSNLQSVVGSIEEDFEYRGSGVWIAFHFSINDGGRSLESSWEACHYILRAMYNVSQIFAKSFDLPEGPWYEQLQLFKNDLDSLNNKIGETIKTLPPPS